MKKIVIYLILSIATVSCYDDYISDNVYNSAYFTYQTDVRTFVVGEGMKFDIGVALGGVMENTMDRVVNYQIVDTLVSATKLASMKAGANYIKNSVATVAVLQKLPTDYYTITDPDQFVIKAGNHAGTLTVQADSAKFLADPATMVATYALPLYITSDDVDSVPKLKNYSVIGVKYENMLFGYYWQGGITYVDSSGIRIDTILYYTAINSTKAWELKTVEPTGLTANGFSNITSGTKQEMKLAINGGDITISSVAGATRVIIPDGTSTFNQAKLLQNRKIFLNYRYVNSKGHDCYAHDTLTFRNRIRDGVNEWQDENPAHYLK